MGRSLYEPACGRDASFPEVRWANSRRSLGVMPGKQVQPVVRKAWRRRRELSYPPRAFQRERPFVHAPLLFEPRATA
jgi:hypothetical protein